MFPVIKTTLVDVCHEFKDRSHLLGTDCTEGKIEQILDLEAEKEFGDHIWSFDSAHEYFDF